MTHPSVYLPSTPAIHTPPTDVITWAASCPACGVVTAWTSRPATAGVVYEIACPCSPVAEEAPHDQL